MQPWSFDLSVDERFVERHVVLVFKTSGAARLTILPRMERTSNMEPCDVD
jgi:hypothetical protein